MEDLEGAPGSPALQDMEEPQGNNDPGDPLNPGLEEEHRPDAPLGSPTADVDAFEDEEAPETVEAMDEAADEEQPTPADDESELEELDEAQFEEFDPANLNIPDKPVAVDETNVGLLGVHKRKRTEEEERERKKKRKEGRREKPKRKKVRAGGDDDVDDEFVGGEEIEGKRARKSKVGPDGRPVKSSRRPRSPVMEDEENLTPDEREFCLFIYYNRVCADTRIIRRPPQSTRQKDGRSCQSRFTCQSPSWSWHRP
jgi:transcription factor SPN1